MIKWVKRIAVVVGVGFFSMVGYLAGLHFGSNFHVVVEGRFYRSAQLDGKTLKAYIDLHNIKTIINLRGASPDADWYQEELAVAAAAGVEHHSVKMSAYYVPSDETVNDLVALLERLPQPILVHCEGGADRSGLASAIFMALQGYYSEFEAEMQLSPLYGHIGIPNLTRAYAMDKAWEGLEARLGYGDG